MRLSALLKDAGAKTSPGFDPEAKGIAIDSRKVRPGDVFFALAGLKADGAGFASQAAANGALAIVAGKIIPGLEPVCVTVKDARLALAIAASNFYGRPHESMTVAGITGTNGKTTTSYLFEEISRAAGRPCGVIGTVEYRHGGRRFDAPHTTPEAPDLMKLMAEMRGSGTGSVVMEVSSHALSMRRADCVAFDAVAFTNLTRDHLDYHGGMEPYFESKARLFMPMPLQGAKRTVAVINLDDPYGRRIAAETKFEKIGVSAGEVPGAAVRPERVRVSIDGIEAVVTTPAGRIGIRSALVGRHNLMNIMTAAGLAIAVGIDPESVEAGVAQLKGVPGRLERVGAAPGVACFVDYAHTDDALKNVLSTLRELNPARIITVFGCGGDRDRGKRPLMGKAAASGSDVVIVTSDNPRTEKPAAIIGEIVPGVLEAGFARSGDGGPGSGRGLFAVVEDRASAIGMAAGCSRPGDVLLIAGKGHEDYQIVGAKKRHFSDREEAERVFGTTGGVNR